MNDEEASFFNDLYNSKKQPNINLNIGNQSEINQNEIRHTTLDFTFLNKTENEFFTNIINFDNNYINYTDENIDINNNNDNDNNDNNFDNYDNNDNNEDISNDNILNEEKFISKSYNNFNKYPFVEDNSKLILNDDFFVDNEHNIEQNNKIVNEENTNIITLNTGKVINTINKQIRNVINELFNKDKIDYEAKSDMQLLKIKKKRRTKSEILKDKTLLKIKVSSK